MATSGKLNEIGNSLYRYDATEEGTVLKGGISNTRYVWIKILHQYECRFVINMGLLCKI